MATPSYRGGNWNFNEFNLALTKNGRTRHLRGRWNANGNRRSNNNNNNSNNGNSNSNNSNNNSNNGNEYVPPSPISTPRTPNYEPRTPNYEPETPNYAAEAPNANKRRNKTNKKKVTSAPNGYSNLAYKGKKYYKKTNSGEVFEITKNGSLGKSMGFYVTPKSGKPYLTQMPPPLESETIKTPVNRLSQPITPISKTQKTNTIMPTQLPPEIENDDASEDIESEAPEGQTESAMKSLSQNGGKRRKRTHKRKQKKRTTRRRR